MYRFAKLPFSSAIARDLVLEIFSREEGPTLRKEIVERVTDFHIESGGLSAKGNPTSMVKKALKTLKDQGLADNVTIGYWRIAGTTTVKTAQTKDERSKTERAPSQPKKDEREAGSDEGTGMREIDLRYEFGDGEESIYAYYLPRDFENAQLRGESRWEIKVGRTSQRNPRNRILEQLGSSHSQKPTTALIYRTNQSANYERVIHDLLSMKGRRIENAPGKEWFITNPNELYFLIRYINAFLLESEN